MTPQGVVNVGWVPDTFGGAVHAPMGGVPGWVFLCGCKCPCGCERAQPAPHVWVHVPPPPTNAILGEKESGLILDQTTVPSSSLPCVRLGHRGI